MNKFVLAFPVPVEQKETFKITEHVQVAPDANTLMIPGCSVSFSVARTEPMAKLSDVFREHVDLSEDDAKKIDSHRSLFFLIGTLKNADDLRMVNSAVLKMFDAGATGVYMQHSGTAWIADAFREEIGDDSLPMDPWINFVESEDVLYTLGLEVFGLPDLCISRKAGSDDELRDILGVVADTLFVDGLSSKSGTEVDAGDFGKYTLRAEMSSPFAKDSPEYNKNGIMRLAKN